MDFRATVPVVQGPEREGYLETLTNTARVGIRRARQRPARIIYLNHGADLGGAEISLLELLRGLDRSRFEPFVVCPGEGDFVTVLREERIPVQIVPLHRLRELEPLPYLATVERLSFLCRDLPADLIHSNSMYAAQFGNLAGRRAGIPTVCHIREWIDSEYGVSAFLLDAADRTVCVSNTVLRQYLKLGGSPDRSTAIYSGIRREPWTSANHDIRRELGISEAAQIVSFVGRIDANKRPHLFLRAAERVSARLPGTHFVLAGGSFACHSDYARRFEGELGASTIGCNFHQLGFRFDIGDLLAASAAFVFTSKREGFPRAVIEAMLHGVPVAATRCEAIDEYLQDGSNGYVIHESDETGEVERLASRLLQILDHDIPSDLRKRAAETASHFTVEANVEQMQKLYGELMAPQEETICALA